MIFLHRLSQPDVMTKKAHDQTQERVRNGLRFVVAPQLFRTAGVMNVADDENFFALHLVNRRKLHQRDALRKSLKISFEHLNKNWRLAKRISPKTFAQLLRKTGKTMLTVAPLFGWLSREIVPRCSWMIR